MRQALVLAALLFLMAAPAAYFLDDGSMLHPFRAVTADTATPAAVDNSRRDIQELTVVSHAIDGGLGEALKNGDPGAQAAGDGFAWLKTHAAPISLNRPATVGSGDEPAAFAFDAPLLRPLPRGEMGLVLIDASASPSAPINDYGAAIASYAIAADPADADARYGLAVIFRDAGNRSRDMTQAYRWMLSAAEHGDPRAEFGLARMYAGGFGVEASPVEAYRWFDAAARGLRSKTDRTEAASRRDQIAAGMTADEQARAKSAVAGRGLSDLTATAGLVALTDAAGGLTDLQ
jgi:hypothetical protein